MSAPAAQASAPGAVADVPHYASGLFAPFRYKVLYGGRGGARSWSVARVLLTLAASRPLRVLCTRELQTSIRDSVHRVLSDQIDLMGIPGYEVTDKEIRHANGSLFIFAGLRHNVTGIKSKEGIDIAWVEEAERVSAESWRVLVPTIRRPGSEIWVTFNPDLETDPTYQRFVAKPPPRSWVRKVGAEDNPWFPAELAEERAYDYAVDPDAAANTWGGELRQATDAQVLRGKWVVEEFEPDPATWDGPYHGADFGFGADPNTLVRCWIAPGTMPKSTGRLMIEREAYKHRQDTDDIAAAWLRAVPDLAGYVIRAENARPETISYLKRGGPHGVDPLPHIVSVDKWPGSVEDGIAHLRQYERIVIHPRCVHAAAEARHWSYKVDARTGDVLPALVDAHNHIWDPVRYALSPLIRLRVAPVTPLRTASRGAVRL